MDFSSQFTGCYNPKIQEEPNQDEAFNNSLALSYPSLMTSFDSFGPEMFSSIGMGGNIHSALLNNCPKQPVLLESYPKPARALPFQPPPTQLLSGPIPLSRFAPNISQQSYSSSGFDLFSILAYLVNRPNPVINIGPVDLSCAFILVDVRKQDFPVVYSSPSFNTLTGYENHEIVGRNCRFLQSPDGCVTSGSRRKFTDNTQVMTIKRELSLFREHQTSIVNYKKGGQPFINLLTMIPIIENGFVNYYVGLQVDLVEQPGAIMKNMHDGNYAVNYGTQLITKELQPEDPFASLAKSFMQPELSDESKANGSSALPEHIDLAQSLIESATEFIYVLSLRGTFLYSSPSVEQLGYTSSELNGLSLSAICHPGDVLPVMRDLKEAASSSGYVCLIYRVKHKEGGYVWIESTGKVHNDIGKGRRCVIFSGRVRPVYQLSHSQLITCGGEPSSEEAWFKLSSCGMLLYVSPNCQSLLGYSAQELNSTSFFQFMPPDQALTLTLSLEQACSGKASRMIHGFQSKSGKFLDVVSILIPGGNPAPPSTKPDFILCRTKLAGFQDFHSPTPTCLSDRNMFEALSPDNTTSWLYELQQLRIKNRRLREEIDCFSPKTSKV
ncbi:hypothetical protein DSO57_1005113 [Entomophthora muscae]|uniref:Uncharacterized protein n=1 Tax=Entomophthora muscae TaxID=34485 RepID=A0ACC2SAJ2_9FUNG|nr:hypothetical protein DSO57_1005113 [Entomophthora muscae]